MEYMVDLVNEFPYHYGSHATDKILINIHDIE